MESLDCTTDWLSCNGQINYKFGHVRCDCLVPDEKMLTFDLFFTVGRGILNLQLSICSDMEWNINWGTQIAKVW